MNHQQTIEDIKQRIKLGLQPIQGKTILHTAPHHDDILLGYFPYAVRNLSGNTNHILYITSGANGISDTYLAKHISMPRQDVQQLDHTHKQALKFAIRESESEKKWDLVVGDQVAIQHLRASFYDVKDDGFALQQAMERDIDRVVEYLKVVQPDVITILVDPVGIGPATHHRSQQVMMQAITQWQQSLTKLQAKTRQSLKKLQVTNSQSKPDEAASEDMVQANFTKPIEILGYRNVWSTFPLEQASMIIPVTQAELDQVESIFMNCFVTQHTTIIVDDDMKNFAQEASQIQKQQWQSVVSLLGDESQQGGQSEFKGAIFLQKVKLQ